MAQWRFVEWLLIWVIETSQFEFDWDAGNRSKNETKHGVSIDEIENVFRLGLALPLGIQTSPVKAEQRLGLIGPTLTGRYLQIAFTLGEGRIRVISARPAHHKERKQYEEILRKIT